MRTIFIMNPDAGQGKMLQRLKEGIKQAAAKLNQEVEIFETERQFAGEEYIKKTLSENPDEQFRIYACGGDGTINEVLNGVMGFNNVAMGLVPIGSGNDFVRNFNATGDHLNIEDQLNGAVSDCDCIKVSGIIDGVEKSRYCANMINIGFDCNVADLQQSLKRYPLVKGSFSYVLSILINLIKKKGANVRVKVGDEVVSEGKIILTAIANGKYCGGGIMSNPYASVNDGNVDINVIRNTGRLNLLTILPKYMKGTHFESERAKKYIKGYCASKVTVTPLDGSMRFCNDGEIMSAGELEFESIKDAFKVIVPMK